LPRAGATTAASSGASSPITTPSVGAPRRAASPSRDIAGAQRAVRTLERPLSPGREPGRARGCCGRDGRGKTSMIAPRRHLVSAAVVLCASAFAAAAEHSGEASRSLVLPSIVGSLPAATAAKRALYLPKSARASHGARLVAGRSGPDTSRCDRRGGVAETREGPPCPHARRA
jgi:hypothetical protein